MAKRGVSESLPQSNTQFPNATSNAQNSLRLGAASYLVSDSYVYR